MANAVYQRPSELMAANPNLRKLIPGMIIDPAALGWAPHPVHGPLPAITVTEVEEDGRLKLGTFFCEEDGCEKAVDVHPGDWFQKRYCDAHRRRHKGASKKLDPAEKDRRFQARKLGWEQGKLDRAQKRVTVQQEAAQKAEADAKERERLILEESQRQNKPVSPKAKEPKPGKTGTTG